MDSDFQAIFDRIRGMFLSVAPRCVLLHDEPGRYYLGSHEVRDKDGYRTWFGGVEIKKSYVSAHLIPVYCHPDLVEGLSPALRKRMQGKSCFNFKALDETLLTELAGLIVAGAARFEADGRL